MPDMTTVIKKNSVPGHKANFAIQKDGRMLSIYWIFPFIKNGAGSPNIKKPDSLATAMPSTLFDAIDTISRDIIIPVTEVKIESRIYINIPILLSANTSKTINETAAAIIVGKTSLEIRYPLFLRGVMNI